jgi:siderophore synthetase component
MRVSTVGHPAVELEPSTDHVVVHTLLNCLIREVSAPEHQCTVLDRHLLIRLPRRDVLLRVEVRRMSLLGAHRFTGPVTERRDNGWAEVEWSRLAEYVRDELELRTGIANDEFLDQVAESHAAVRRGLGARRLAAKPARTAEDEYLDSERALVFGHRFHPTPKSRSGEALRWADYAPETSTGFPLRYLAVRGEHIGQEEAFLGATAMLDELRVAPSGYRLLPVHPWQYEMLRGHPALRAAMDRDDVLDLGVGGQDFVPTASVRTLYHREGFLKFSLNVRITNCVRKNAAYELFGAVAMTRLLTPVFGALAERFPSATMLGEPAFRTLDLGDRELFEGFGVIVRDSLHRHLRPGVTPLLAAAVADEYPTSGAQVSRLLGTAAGDRVLAWWNAYLGLVLPPVLAAYFDHGVVLEPHLQNVLIGVDHEGMPAQVLFRDLEGTKLVPEHHSAVLAAMSPEVAASMSYEAGQGWDRVVYCLFVNHVAEMISALADLRPELEAQLWMLVRNHLCDYERAHGCPPQLRALLSGVPMPAKANLLGRWARKADRQIGYVPVPSLLGESFLAGVVR